jgi:hypothetical protein
MTGALTRLTHLELVGRFRADESASLVPSETRQPFEPPRLTRLAVACLIAGVGLLTLADAAWAHAIGVVCWLGFMVVAFLAIVPRALAGQAANTPAEVTGRFSPTRIRRSSDPGSGSSS